jgi:hypothetical protein
MPRAIAFSRPAGPMVAGAARVTLCLVAGAVLALFPTSALLDAQAPVQAQTRRNVSVIVLDADTNQPIDDASVVVGGAAGRTNPAGRLTLQVPGGQAVVAIRATGYFPLDSALDVSDQDIVDARFVLAPNTPFSTSVSVVGTAPATAPASVEVQPTEVMQTPGALDNIFRALQTLPGVAAADEFGSRITVRGGAPDQNLTMMDGAEVHDPYRLYGLTSAFNPEIIQRFELFTGGFSPKYGDRLSSLLTIDNREGDRQRRVKGTGSLSVTDANLVFEGGLPGGSGSWLVTGRRTYYDLVASRVANQDFPKFGDLQTKVVKDLAPGHQLSVFGLRSRQSAALDLDTSDVRGELQDDTQNDLVSVRSDNTVGRRGRSHTIASYSNTRSIFGVDAATENRTERSNAPDASFAVDNVRFERRLAIRDFALRQEVAWAFDAHTIETGGEVHRLATTVGFANRGDNNSTADNGASVEGGALPLSLDSSYRSTRMGAWLIDTWQAHPRVSIETGLRLDKGGVAGDTTLSPRATAQIQLTPGARLRVAAGRYTQSAGYEKLIQSDYVLDLTAPKAAGVRSEIADQVSAGVEQTLPLGATVRVEGYYKRFQDLLIGRLETESERLARVATYDFPPALASSVPTEPLITTVPINGGVGRAYGLDVFLTRPKAPVDARLRGWASYTWGRAEREAYGLRYPFKYDRRHAFSGVAGYRLSARWDLSTTVRLASGFPRTPLLGLRVASRVDERDADGDGNSTERIPAVDQNGLLVYGVNFGGVSNINTARLPMFARVDVRATWRPRGAEGRWEMYMEVINVLNRKNAGALSPELAYDPSADRPRVVEKPDQGVPLLPTVGLRFRF